MGRFLLSDPLADRVFGPNCCWYWHDDCLAELGSLAEIDDWGHGRLMSMIARSESGKGLVLEGERETIRAPLPRAPRGVTRPPWVGELRLRGDQVYRKRAYPYWEHRIFYGVPTNETWAIVGLGAWSKRSDDRKADGKQEDQIRRAMHRLKWFFGQQGYTWNDL